ncbi:rhodanese-like domain-containing protein [Aquabacterium sp. UBA2148]|uniref:rhodanese-like domain-containing protein n=1 Tax=Aquabacterium sp. UBA2148 TaxID=1946042 RepID=UPI0025796EBD|nr:rhodanese-like domain-containing protein [Aquabacterium sp. UBA2148]
MTSSSFLADNWIWILAAASSGGILLWQQLQQAGNGGITPALAVQLMNKEKAVVIDVCSAEEFAAGHVAGAKHIPLADLGTAKGLPGNKKLPIVVVCASGQRSAKAVVELKKLGHENVQSLAGGLKAWREANLPIEKASKA